MDAVFIDVAGISAISPSSTWLVFLVRPQTAGDWFEQAKAVLRHYLLISPDDCNLGADEAEQCFSASQDPFEYAERLADKYALDPWVPFPPAHWRFSPPSTAV